MPRETNLRRATSGYAPEVAGGDWVVVPVEAELPGPQAARTGETLWLSGRDRAERAFPLLREVFAHTPWEALCALPLAVGRRQGFFVAFFAEEREFDEDERRFTEAIVTLCGQALERAHLLDMARAARDRSRRLQAVTAALSAAATPEEVGGVIVRDGLVALHADAVLMYVRDDSALKLVAHAGYEEDVLAEWSQIPEAVDAPVAHVIRTPETLVFSSPAEARERFPLLARSPIRHGERPSVIVPLVVRGEPIGALCAIFVATHRVDDDDVSLVESVARLCAQALERSRLLDAERVAADRIRRLQTVTARLGGAMTVEEIAHVIVREGVAALGGAAGALVRRHDADTLETVAAIGYSDELLDLYRRFPVDGSLVAAQVMREGIPRWVESLAEMEATYPSEELELDPHLQAEAYVPLVAAGTVIGVLLVSFAGARRLTEDEKELFLTLGRQCAQALSNARMFEREHLIAEGLQRALLPAAIAAPAVLRVAARYLPRLGRAPLLRGRPPAPAPAASRRQLRIR
jgi:GAF domain-containing protein